MPRCLPLLSAISIILIAITSIHLWQPEYGLGNAHLHLTAKKPKAQNTQHNKSYSDDFLCPANDGEPTLKCGTDCYRSNVFTCPNDKLIQPACSNGSCVQTPGQKMNSTTLHISSPPYENYFYSDCNVAAQVVVTSPLPDSDLEVIGPRLIVAWPAGNSGACIFFKPENALNGSLAIKLINSTVGSPLAPIYVARDGYPSVGVKGVLYFNTPAVLSLSILGSIRAVRDFTEGPSLLHPMLQEAIHVKKFGTNGAAISRLWLDNVTTTTLTFTPGHSGNIKFHGQKAILEEGEYLFSAHYNYPQLRQLSLDDVLKDKSLIEQHQLETKALSFLSYSEKVLAGAWRFLTYFGRDDMISTLVLLPVLTENVVEAVIGSVLERINRTDGSACHEETIGDYATYMNLREGAGSTAYRCDYSMVDTDYFVPILMHSHFGEFGAGRERLEALLSTPAGTVDPNNKDLTWGDLFIILARKIMNNTAPFAAPGGQTRTNLIHLKEGHETGVWRDSVYGIGGGRIPFDVNVALVPAALRAIASLAREFNTSVLGEYARDWAVLADQYAQVWENTTLEFFKIVLSAADARERLESFVNTSTFYNGPPHSGLIDSDVSYYALALEGNNDVDKVTVMHTDACCRIFFLNGTNQARLTDYLNATALSILRPFPAGLMTPVGLVVANPAISENEIVKQNFTNSAYHGAVVWSWQLVAMVRGLEKQLGRCSLVDPHQRPDFCSDAVVYNNVRNAYNTLWDVLEANKDFLSDEVWSWVYKDGKFIQTPLGSMQAPPGVEGIAESDIIQLWSLMILAMKRNEQLRYQQ
ncbi:hypothetical protein LTR70_009230 [Exophiala xenobiotica]|uniref:Endo-1,3(4)-beta-glucanase 1 carbohydrate binding domain-containing protein n=1 Tax=Lithohypha guttulata TaxID=1690604 RepID=A0ABR0K1B4_9EURO|nr:hypothetical protein LTR24_008323 [Lithohypha guttulata]KAK5310772.1 hypothetical protein LTR70_009230 [Exophiala xenobiotica]